MAPSQLQIKVSALKRLIKEKDMYQREVSEQEQYVNQLKANNGDEYELKKQVEVLDESKRMVPQVSKKIEELKKSLSEYLENYTGDEDVTEAKDLLN
ncbi:RBL2 [Candida theae]|uniref:Tubulin-specific chaperone A n=1 Tax=Candida theae TaxID=1198502 RepID=A0AAD5FYT3_9ASCO|nr:RBL2 [Candida theae]KAI5958806.1 RBL2 [Candida theae]